MQDFVSPTGNIQETGKADNIPGFVYNMEKGFVLLINNDNFPERTDVWRKGSEVDAEGLERYFKIDLGFEFRKEENLSAKEMLRLIKGYSEKDFSKYDSFFLFISSHGNQNGILGTDEKPIAVDAVTGLFTADRCPSLADKPKSFFIQACRGDADDCGAVVSDASMSSPPQYQIPIESDFLVAYSSPPGYASFRDLQTGSWFIQTLLKIFKIYSVTDHLMDMLLMVNHYIAKKLVVSNLKQMPLQECRLTKKCYFRHSNV